jgi:glycosyltransferase involved in cell wall biosynthesis
MKVLFFIPAPLNISPGQRFRFEHYLPYLEENGIKYSVQTFWSHDVWKRLFIKGFLRLKVQGVLGGFFRRLFFFIKLHEYDYVFIYREVAPVGPPFFEWMIAKVWRKKIIYDFDDAIWLSTSSNANPKASFIKCSWKVGLICKYSKIVSVGNNFLAGYVKRFNSSVVVIPTVVNTKNVHVGFQNQEQNQVTIGWTGTFTNFHHLQLITGVIQKLERKYSVRFLIIAEKDPELKDVNYSFKKWNFNSEIADLLRINIGVMPLNNSTIELGKCGFKAIQFMSLGIPVVVSPVGANCDVVKNNQTGFWASNEEEWFTSLEKLIVDKELRKRIGWNAQKIIQQNYSVDATIHQFINLFS